MVMYGAPPELNVQRYFMQIHKFHNLDNEYEYTLYTIFIYQRANKKLKKGIPLGKLIKM